MKKFALVLLAIIMSFSAFQCVAFAAETDSSSVAGDVNGDGYVNICDLIRFKRVLSKSETSINAGNADCNGDYLVNAKDMTQLKKYLMGIEGSEPVAHVPMYTATEGQGTLTEELSWHEDDSSISGVYQNGTWNRWAELYINDSIFNAGATLADSIEFWTLITLTDNCSGELAQVQLDVLSNSDVKLMDSINLPIDQWVKVSLNADAMEKYLSNSGLKLLVTTPEDVTFVGYKMYLDDAKLNKNTNSDYIEAAGLFSSANGTIAADKNYIHGTKDAYSAKFTNNTWSGWSFLTFNRMPDLPEFSATDDAVRFWVYLDPGDTTSVSLALVHLADETTIKGDVTLTQNGWSCITLSVEEYERLAAADDGVRIRLTSVGGANNYSVYIDDFGVDFILNKQVSNYLSSSQGTISASSVGYGNNGSQSALFKNGVWNRWSFISVDDKALFGNDLTENDRIEFMVYFSKNTDSGMTEPIILDIVAESTESIIKSVGSIPWNTWTKVSMTAEEMKTYLETNDGFRLRTTVSDGEYMGFDLFIDDFVVIKG